MAILNQRDFAKYQKFMTELMVPLIEDHGEKYFNSNRCKLIFGVTKHLDEKTFSKIIHDFIAENKKPSVNDFKIKAQAYKQHHLPDCHDCNNVGWHVARRRSDGDEHAVLCWCARGKIQKKYRSPNFSYWHNSMREEFQLVSAEEWWFKKYGEQIPLTGLTESEKY